MIDKISVYSRVCYQEFSFPTVSEQMTSFTIEKEIHGIKEDLTVCMEVLDNCWCFSESRDYKILK